MRDKVSGKKFYPYKVYEAGSVDNENTTGHSGKDTGYLKLITY